MKNCGWKSSEHTLNSGEERKFYYCIPDFVPYQERIRSCATAPDETTSSLGHITNKGGRTTDGGTPSSGITLSLMIMDFHSNLALTGELILFVNKTC